MKTDKLKAFLVNYNYTPEWLLTSDLDYHIVDRSDSKEYLKDFPQERITYEENFGQVDYPKLCFLADNYEHLPDVFLWGKTNLHKYISVGEWEKVKGNKCFTPLLTQDHKTYSDQLGPVCYYDQGMYWERNNSWYLNSLPARYFDSFSQFANEFGLASPHYIPFAPGGNCLLTREVVHKYSPDFYDKMASVLPYCQEPGEAQMCERAYYLMWK